MKVILVGASGTLGSAIAARLGSRHELIRVGRQSGDLQVDITQPESIRTLFAQVGRFDALISAVGSVTFAPFTEMTPEAFQKGLQDKLMGQVNLVLLGQAQAADGASFTLTTGILSPSPRAARRPWSMPPWRASYAARPLSCRGVSVSTR